MALMLEALGLRRVRSRPAAVFSAVMATSLVLLTSAGSAIALVRQDPRSTIDARTPAWGWLIVLVAGVGLIAAAWTLLPTRPRAVAGVAILALGWLIPRWAGWSTLPQAIRVAALAAAPLSIGGMILIGVGWPRRTEPRARSAARVAVALCGCAALILLLGDDPFADPLCIRTCDSAPALLSAQLTTEAAVKIASLLVAVSVVLGLPAVLRTREIPLDVRVAVIAALGVLGTTWVLRAIEWGETAPVAERLALEPFAVAVVAVAVSASAARTLRTRNAANRLVYQLAGARGIDLGAAGVITAVQFAVPDEDRWLDERGIDLSSAGLIEPSLVLTDESGPAIRLTFGRHADELDVLTGLSPANRLALSNARLAAVLRTRLKDVQASQRRLVAVSDAERRRIERDLHDGAQQRLVSAALHVNLALGRADTGDQAALRVVDERLRVTLAHLRDLAHGMFPSTLLDEGLQVALSELVATSEVLAVLEVRGDGDVSMEVAMAAFSTVAATLEVTDRPDFPITAQILVEYDRERLKLQIHLDSPGELELHSTIVDSSDRVGAAGGRLVVTRKSPQHVMILAVIPCA